MHTKAIHTMRGLLKFDEATYRALLVDTTGKDSCKKMTYAEQLAVRVKMESLCRDYGIAPATSAANRKTPLRPVEAPHKTPLVKKVRAMLIANGRLPNSYADKLASTMYNKAFYELCEVSELQGICVALKRQFARQTQVG